MHKYEESESSNYVIQPKLTEIHGYVFVLLRQCSLLRCLLPGNKWRDDIINNLSK